MTLVSEVAGRLLGLPRPLSRSIIVDRDLRVPMADGAVLLADRHAPPTPGPHPTVLVRSPYGRRGPFGLLYGRLLAERGLQVVVQSVRGTFGSDGAFTPFDEQADGLATLDWLERQPWHAGPVGMAGASYLGVTQWAAASAAPERLSALALSTTASRVHGQAFGGGSLSLETALAWTLIVAGQERRGGALRLMRALRRLPRLADHLPIAEIDALATGEAVPFFGEWMQHTSSEDPYWAARDFSMGREQVTAPAQFVAGRFDIFLPWMLEDFEALQAAGRSPRLVLGPWTHMAPALVAADTRETLAWLRAHLLDDDRLVDPAPVRVHVGGGPGWRALDRWPPASRPLRLHLHAGGRLDREPPPAAAPDRFRYDPASPTPSLGGPGLLAREPVLDNRPLEARDDVLTYTTAPLEADLEIIGRVEVELHVDSSVAHFDVFARVCDVDRSGVSRNVTDALQRVGPDMEGALDGSATRVRFELWPTAHRFAAGHRIRLVVAGGAHPRYARNPGTGEDPGRATRMVAAEHSVLHDPGHLSALVLPELAP